MTGYTGDRDSLPALIRGQITEFTDALSLDFLRAETEYKAERDRWVSTIP